MKHICLGILFFHCATTVWANPKIADRENVIAEVKFAPLNRCIIVPVMIDAKQYSFILDTGSSISAFDASLSSKLTKTARTVKVFSGNKGTTRPVDVELFTPPANASIGGIRFSDTNPVICVDLAHVRDFGGFPIFGVIGMDLLVDYVVQIDSDSGKVRFLRYAAGNLGETLQMQISEAGMPRIDLELENRIVTFDVNTAIYGYFTGILEPELYDTLQEKGVLRSAGEQVLLRFGTAKQNVNIPYSRLNVLQVASGQLEDVRFGRSASNTLGMGFLRRFVVTFDFPKRTLYLKRGRRQTSDDDRNLVGLGIERVNGRYQIADVEKGSPAEAAGIEYGDVLSQIDGKVVDELSFFEIGHMARREGEKVRFVLFRGQERITTTLVPRDWKKSAKTPSSISENSPD